MNGNVFSRWRHIRGGDELLAACYRNAAALLYPSIYEGFGLPVLEAMELGCPVITTPCKSLPEVGGDAVLYSEPGDIDGFFKCMREIFENPAQAAALAKKGIERSKIFSWEKTAQATLAAYGSLLARAS